MNFYSGPAPCLKIYEDKDQIAVFKKKKYASDRAR